MLAGLHAAVLLFHNKAVDYVRARDQRADDEEVFERAQRLTRWHYQWMIVHEWSGRRTGRIARASPAPRCRPTIAGFDPDNPTPISLPQRNLLRQVTWSLPSGQKIAREIGAEPVNMPQFAGLRGRDYDLERSSPLWAYCLHEGFALAGGLTLGPVGGPGCGWTPARSGTWRVTCGSCCWRTGRCAPGPAST
jgi:hypothetical protein